MKLASSKLPQHVAIIMDGNRRWAAQRGLPAVAGHKQVVEQSIEPIIEQAGKLGIDYITFWAWSTDNWTRGKEEVGGIMGLFRYALAHKARQMIKKGARLKVIGNLEAFEPDIQKGIQQMIAESEKNSAITVTFALNYGGRNEVTRAVIKIADKLKSGELDTTQINEDLISQHLDTSGMPDPDLIIRTGGTKRLSGFMCWQSEYSELYFTEVLMPDFGVEQLELALKEYSVRDRRFGGGKFTDYKNAKA